MRHRKSKVPEERNRDRVEKLLAENRKLRKQVAQLQKHIARVNNREQDIQEIIEEYEQSQKEVEIISTKPQCPLCGSYDIQVMEKLLNDKDYFSCNNCQGRGKLR